MLNEIREAWGWVGIKPVSIIAQNAFGNLIICDERNFYWRLCPEDLYCQVIADSKEEYLSLLDNEEFILDWEMKTLVDAAKSKYGALLSKQCYCLKIPGVLGGSYNLENIGTNSRMELISFSGDIAKQINDLPDGAQIKLKITGESNNT